MNLAEINWDINYVGKWPWPVKLAIIAIFGALAGGAWYYFDIQSQREALTKVQDKELELKTAFETKYKKAANLDEIRKQLADMEKVFGDMLRQLPDKTQVAELLVDISQTGLASGLEFELFKPQAESKKDFYAELPIDVRVTGSYAKLGTFVSGLAALPRIVTIHNVKIAGKTTTPTAGSKAPATGETLLAMTCVIKTYRYLEEGEAAKAKPPAKGPAKPAAKAPAKGKE